MFSEMSVLLLAVIVLLFLIRFVVAYMSDMRRARRVNPDKEWSPDVDKTKAETIMSKGADNFY